MFRKDGFVNHSEVVDRVWAAQGEQTEDFPDAEMGMPDKKWRQQTFIRWKAKMLFEGESHTYLISDKGDVVKLDSSLVLSPSPFIARINSALRKSGTSGKLSVLDRIYIRLFDGARGNIRYLEQETYLGWEFIDTALGTVSLRSKGWLRQFREPSLYRRMRDALRPFDGWSIALDVKSLEDQIALWTEPDDPTKGSGLEHAYYCFVKAFPDGKGSATWAEVQEKTGYSRRQINRALSEYGGREVSRKLGRTARNGGQPRH